MTKSELRELWKIIQKEVGAAVDGIPGVFTAKAVSKRLGIEVAPISSGPDVWKAVQKKLGLTADGIAGPLTAKAVYSNISNSGTETGNEAAKKIVWLIAGHGGSDPGAVSGNRKEREYTIEFQNGVAEALKGAQGIDVRRDPDAESTSPTISRIKSLVRTDDLVIDVHFNAYNGSASGFECIIPDSYSANELALAANLAESMKSLGFTLRGSVGGKAGVKTESSSKRGRLGMMRLNAITVLPEIAFIDNDSEMAKYNSLKKNIWSLFSDVIKNFKN